MPRRRTGGSAEALDRRDALKLLAGGAAAAGLGVASQGCAASGSTTKKKVVVLGLDGLDPQIVQALIDAGRAPNFKKLGQLGSFMKLGTTMPALSPVAWSSFITGLTPGGHGIGDFIVRDPQTYTPVFSIYETESPRWVINIGDYQFPLAGGGATNLRRGKPFWAYLLERGIPAVVVKIPTNFPVDETVTRGVSGMGTPDLTDAYGVFNYYTSDEFEHYPNLSGGNVFYIQVNNHRAQAELIGPVNSLRRAKEDSRDRFANNAKIPFTVYRDPDSDSVRIDIQSQTLVLAKNEYSDWVHVSFELMPLLGNVSGIVRFLVKEVHPQLKIYVTPINIDPEDQAMPVTYPVEYGAELARVIGPFWTKGLPADTKAFDYRVIDDEQYVKQAELVLEERMALFDYEWSRFESGLFYFYVSSTDQDAHMLWRNMDETHPMHEASDVRFAGYLYHLYERMDELVGKVLPALDEDTLLLICSDHGFAQFGRQFHLNTWLRDRGYLTLKTGAEKKDETSIFDVDWASTLAYGVGFNGLYLNLQGREGQGQIRPEDAGKLAGRLKRELEAITDGETGKRPVANVYSKAELYSGEMTPLMPELLVGYTPGYRCSSASVLGSTGEAIIDINPWAWSGDHSMARDLVPGTLFSSLPLKAGDPNIVDLPVTILDFFGIEKPPQMVGRSLFKT
ncbi:MAG: alkaline phosphatase family protein [Acidobacteriota bacterium]|nr:MAG: alkaline phosphatase family protein [Acidobacteriota bacterium]